MSPIKPNLPPKWQAFIAEQQQQEYYQQLMTDLDQQKAAGEIIFPDEHDIFNAFAYADVPDIKVVILGQDPYHGLGENEVPQAHGLAFSVPKGIKAPPSLVNIYKTLALDIKGFVTPNHGCLTRWAEQGVLLLNTVLTVKKGQANSHQNLGWEKFTDAVIDKLNKESSGCVFLLWGSHAQKKGQSINREKHYVLTSVHPSPLSAYRGFFDCQHFSKANYWLKNNGKNAIDWSLE
ncbi:uracil-DNA glycosylase [Thalassotalea ganghwensis]